VEAFTEIIIEKSVITEIGHISEARGVDVPAAATMMRRVEPVTSAAVPTPVSVVAVIFRASPKSGLLQGLRSRWSQRYCQTSSKSHAW